MKLLSVLLQVWRAGCKQLKYLRITLERLHHHRFWQLDRRLLVEMNGLQIVSHHLLIKRVLRSPYDVLGHVPKARAIGSKHLIG